MSNLKRLKKIPSKNAELTQVQQNVEEALNPLINAPIADGTLIKNVTLCASIANLVTHKLGRKALG